MNAHTAWRKKFLISFDSSLISGHSCHRPKLMRYRVDYTGSDRKPVSPTHCLQRLLGDDRHIKALVPQSALGLRHKGAVLCTDRICAGNIFRFIYTCPLWTRNHCLARWWCEFSWRRQLRSLVWARRLFISFWDETLLEVSGPAPSSGTKPLLVLIIDSEGYSSLIPSAILCVPRT